MSSTDRFKDRKRRLENAREATDEAAIDEISALDKELASKYLTPVSGKATDVQNTQNTMITTGSRASEIFIEMDAHNMARQTNLTMGVYNIEMEDPGEFLERFRKEYDKRRFDALISECQELALRPVITHFGLGGFVSGVNRGFMRADRDGGSVTTLHNFKKGITANKRDDILARDYLYTNMAKDRSAHDTAKNKIRDKAQQGLGEGEVLKDAYTGEVLGIKLDGTKDYDLDHVKPVKEIDTDARNWLGSDTTNPWRLQEERVALSSDASNLAFTNSSLNRSKGAKSMDEFTSTKRKDGSTNAEHFGIDENRASSRARQADAAYEARVAPRYYKEQAMRLGVGALSEGAKMGVQAALGVMLSELFTAIFAEVRDIWKNGFVGDFEGIWDALIKRMGAVQQRVLSSYKDVLAAFRDGAISGALSAALTMVINTVVTTGRRMVRIIREGFYAFFIAIKNIIFPREGQTREEALHEGKKLIAAAIITSLGLLLEEAVEKALLNTPLAPFAGLVSAVLVGGLTGLAIALVCYYIDAKKHEENITNELVKYCREGQAKVGEKLASLEEGLASERYYSLLL